VSFTLYGSEGPWSGRPGFENQAQAASGIQERFGGGQGPAKEALPINDYGSSLLGCLGVALALYERNKGGAVCGQHVSTGLTFSATMMQGAAVLATTGPAPGVPRGQMALGTGALHRAYRASDGWLFLGARESDLARLDGVAGLGGLAALPAVRRAAALEILFARDTRDAWVARLQAAGIGAHAVSTIAEVMALPYARERGIFLERDHPDGGRIATIGPIPRLSRTPLDPGRPARPTMDGPEVLAEVGLGALVERYLETRVIRVQPSRRRAAAAAAQANGAESAGRAKAGPRPSG